MRETYDLLKLPYLFSESPFLSLPSWQECFPPFFYRHWAFYQASRFRLLACKIFLFLLFLFISVLAVFFFLLSSICAHINIWSTIIAVSHIMDNAQLRVMKKKNNKKIASLDKKNKKNKNFCHLGKRGRLIKNAKAWKKKT